MRNHCRNQGARVHVPQSLLEISICLRLPPPDPTGALPLDHAGRLPFQTSSFVPRSKSLATPLSVTWYRPSILRGRHSEGPPFLWEPPFSAISTSDNLRLGIRLGLWIRLGLGLRYRVKVSRPCIYDTLALCQNDASLIRKSSSTDSPRTPELQCTSRNSKGVTPSESGVGKLAFFGIEFTVSQKKYNAGPKLLLATKRKLHTRPVLELQIIYDNMASKSEPENFWG